QVVDPDGVKIVIEPFEDRRAEKSRIGMRTHLWGGTTYFNVAGEKPGQGYAQVLADRLQTKGRHEHASQVRVAPAGSVHDADIVISGQTFAFAGNAKSRMFST